MSETVTTIVLPTPTFMGCRYPGGDYDAAYSLVLLTYLYQGARFQVLVRGVDDDDYDLEESIEGEFIIELEDLSYGEQNAENDKRWRQLEYQLASLASDACLGLMRKLGPPVPFPEPRTLQEQLYPETYMLQVLTEDNRLVARRLESYEPPTMHPPVPEARLREIGLDENNIPILTPAEIVLGPRLQSLVWKVEVAGEEMICKAYDAFENAIGDELETYLKIQGSGLGGQLKVPQLRGIVRSHTGMIGILLGYIPHAHHSLRILLDGVKKRELAETEATASMKRKWAGQIKQSVAQLHSIGILWRDIKTDNVLIDSNGDAVVLDFGGGNTVGWVDQDKFGTLEGDLQGLEKILAALE